jgi:hypothetical protein
LIFVRNLLAKDFAPLFRSESTSLNVKEDLFGAPVPLSSFKSKESDQNDFLSINKPKNMIFVREKAEKTANEIILANKKKSELLFNERIIQKQRPASSISHNSIPPSGYMTSAEKQLVPSSHTPVKPILSSKTSFLSKSKSLGKYKKIQRSSSSCLLSNVESLAKSHYLPSGEVIRPISSLLRRFLHFYLLAF